MGESETGGTGSFVPKSSGSTASGETDTRPPGQDDPAIVGHHGVGVPGEDEAVGVASVPVQGEEMDIALLVLVILLADHVSVHTPDAHIAVLQGPASNTVGFGSGLTRNG